MAITRRRFLRGAAALGTVGALRVRPVEGQVPNQLPPIHFDDNGLIVHRGQDGGDTAQREGWYWFGVWIRKKINDPWTVKRDRTFPEVIQRLEPKGDGVFCRHPKFDPYDRKWGFSRDQMIPLVAAMGVWGLTACFRCLFP